VNLPDAGRPLLGYERETVGHVGARMHTQITLFGTGLAESQQTEAGAHIGGYLKPSLSLPHLTRTSAAATCS